MKTKNFKLIYTKLIYVLLSLLLAMALASAILNILIIAEVGTFSNAAPAVTTVSLVCSLILTALAVVVLFFSRYSLAVLGVRVQFGVFGYTISYRNIYEIKEHNVTRDLFLLFKEPTSPIPDKTSATQLAIKKSQNEEFIAALREKNPEIVYTLYVPEN